MSLVIITEITVTIDLLTFNIRFTAGNNDLV